MLVHLDLVPLTGKTLDEIQLHVMTALHRILIREGYYVDESLLVSHG